jgi:hypothetical protein
MFPKICKSGENSEEHFCKSFLLVSVVFKNITLTNFLTFTISHKTLKVGNKVITGQ